MNYLMTKQQAVLHIEFHNMSRIDHKEIGNTDTAGIAGTEDIVDTEDIVVEEHIAVAEEEHIEVHNIETQGTGNTVDNRLLEVLH